MLVTEPVGPTKNTKEREKEKEEYGSYRQTRPKVLTKFRQNEKGLANSGGEGKLLGTRIEERMRKNGKGKRKNQTLQKSR